MPPHHAAAALLTLRRNQVSNGTPEPAERRLAALVSALPAAAIWVDRDAIVTGWEAATSSLLGIDADDAVGAPLADLVVDPDDRLFEAIRAAARGETVGETETALWRRDGQIVNLRVSVAPELGESGLPIGAALVLTDIADACRAREALAYQEQVLASVGEAIIAVDERLTITAWNRVAEEVYGWSAFEVLGRGVGDVLRTEVPDADFAEAVRTLLERGFFAGEVVQRSRDGRELRIAVRAAAVKNEVGRASGFVMVNRDVTASREGERERARLAAELRQSQKLEALGQLAAGVAHDFNNLLTAIQGFGELLSSRLDDDRLRRDADEVVQAAERGAALTRQLLAFSRRDEGTPALVNVSELVRGLESLLDRSLGGSVALELALSDGLPPVLADHGQLEQVVLNLALNARDAMPEGGTLTLRTVWLPPGDDLLPAELAGCPQGAVSLVVADTGTGMSEEVQARAFEPFFTTKERGRGTGLGLATVWGMVSRAGGLPLLDSRLGEGTTVSVLLPAVERVVDDSLTGAPDEPASGGRETVLVVEDEDAVRRLACRILSDGGYRVLSAPDARAALDLAAVHPGPLDLVLTDVMLPGMKGGELAATIADLRPGTRAVAMSGYAWRELVEGGFPDGMPLIPKPFKQDVLLGRVRDVLDRR